MRLRPSAALDPSLQVQGFLFATRQGPLRAHEEVFRVTQAEDMASADLPVFQKADGTDDQLNLQIDEDAAFHTTVHWLRVDSYGRCTQTTVGRVSANEPRGHRPSTLAKLASQEEKGSVVARLRVPFRDLRILDPLVRTYTKQLTKDICLHAAQAVSLQSYFVLQHANLCDVCSCPRLTQLQYTSESVRW